MDVSQAVALIRDAVGAPTKVWAEMGAGSGTFTRALVELLGPRSRIYAVDRDAGAVSELARWSATEAPNVVALKADFTRLSDLHHFSDNPLDGILLANALHFVRDAQSVLAQLVALLRPGGRVVLVEYDRRDASRWVPYPIPIARLPKLAAAAGLLTPTVTATHPSEYQGILYAAVAMRAESLAGQIEAFT